MKRLLFFLFVPLISCAGDLSDASTNDVFVDGFYAFGEKARYGVSLELVVKSPSWAPTLENFPADLRSLAVKSLSFVPSAHEFSQNRRPSTRFEILDITIKRVTVSERQHPQTKTPTSAEVSNKWAVAFTFTAVDGRPASFKIKRVVLLLGGQTSSETLRTSLPIPTKPLTNSWPAQIATPKMPRVSSPSVVVPQDGAGQKWNPLEMPFPLDLLAATRRSQQYVYDRFHTVGETTLEQIRISPANKPLAVGTILNDAEFRELEVNNWAATFTFVDEAMAFSDVKMTLDGIIIPESTH